MLSTSARRSQWLLREAVPMTAQTTQALADAAGRQIDSVTLDHRRTRPRLPADFREEERYERLNPQTR